MKMNASLGIALLLLQTGLILSSRLVDRRQSALKFGQTLNDYILFKPDMSPLQSALSVCSWVKKLTTSTYPTWLNYATSSVNHEIFISADGYRNGLLNNNLDLSSKINPDMGEWHHHCTTWSTSSNTRKVYYNGELVGQSATPSRTLGLEGYLILGHERHFDGSSREEAEIFGGELFKVNFFAKELTGEEVKAMTTAGLCSDVEEGYGRVRYLRWEDLLLEQRNGNVTEVDPGCPTRHCEAKPSEESPNETEEPTSGENDEEECECKGREGIDKWDILYSGEFFNRTLTEELLEDLKSYWDILGHFVGTTITEGVITHFKIFHSTKDSCS